MAHHVLEIRTDATGEAREHVRNDLGTALSSGKVSDAQLMTSELVANAVQHARLEPGATIGLDITVAARSINISVVDAGVGFAHEEGDKDFGGWGLVIVERLSDRWGIRQDHPHSVWFEIDR
jgi:anti-sigma regulatory factor (Ser/Thr protein kinase)